MKMLTNRTVQTRVPAGTNSEAVMSIYFSELLRRRDLRRAISRIASVN